MRIEKCIYTIVGEWVAQEAKRNREWTRIYANLGERDRPGRRVWRLAKHFRVSFFAAGVGRETHPAATGTITLPSNQLAENSRPFASIRGCMLYFLIIQKQLTQVVDFPDSFGYSCMPWSQCPAKSCTRPRTRQRNISCGQTGNIRVWLKP